MATIECKAAGTVSASDVEAVRELLLGLSGFSALPVRQHETVLKGPVHERMSSKLRLTQYLTISPVTSPSPHTKTVDESRCVSQ